ncbi:MAG: ion transporter [Planctomycetes bacterium]|nr:ion transporter [Planctomycetota bacterium]
MSESRTEGWRQRWYVIIFEADTPAGKAFDVALILAILTSVVVVMLESVASIREQHGEALYLAEWGFTILFTLEYLARLSCTRRPLRYARSFFGVVDLLAILPTYLIALFPAARYLMVVRVLRLLRAFRVLKLAAYVRESDLLMRSLRASRRKITVFLFAIFALTLILGSLMYLIEGEEHGFDSIPRGVYWAIVTLTTVGYGDISPETPLGQFVAALVMIMGYGVIAVPTGIVSAEMALAATQEGKRFVCGACGVGSHVSAARFCHGCGAGFEDTSE